MKHCTWVYVDDNSIHHHVGLYHGPESGNLMIYCDNNVIAVDFEVFNSKVYTFFIEDELLEVRLERKGDEMYYDFVINKKADTFRNRLRKKIDKSNLRQLWILILGMAILIGVATVFIVRREVKTPYIDPFILETTGVKTTARVRILQQTLPVRVDYAFIANNQLFQSEPVQLSSTILETGMPLEHGDEFELYYLPDHPASNSIFWDRPTPQQIDRYFQRVCARQLTFYPATDTSLIRCELIEAYYIFGFPALADFYFQKTETFENPYHNKETYEKMRMDNRFKEGVKKSCR